MIRLLLWLPLAFVGVSWLAMAIAARHRPPPVMLPAVLMPCGCLRIQGGLLLPCPAHAPAPEPPVEQWAAEISEEDR